MAEIRILVPDDRVTLEAFLLQRVESSMFLIGNMRAAGLVDGGQIYEGTYAAAFEGPEIVGAVAHFWNGMLIFQAPAHLDALWRAATRISGRHIKGLAGPGEQVREFRLLTGLDGLVEPQGDRDRHGAGLVILHRGGRLYGQLCDCRARSIDLYGCTSVNLCAPVTHKISPREDGVGCAGGGGIGDDKESAVLCA